MLAIIKTGGKQYKVSPNQKIKIEKIEGEQGKEVFFDEVLLVQDKDDVKIGTPFVKGAKAIGRIILQGRGKKVTTLKYKPKTRYKKKTGQRQFFTEVEILSIEAK